MAFRCHYRHLTCFAGRIYPQSAMHIAWNVELGAQNLRFKSGIMRTHSFSFGWCSYLTRCSSYIDDFPEQIPSHRLSYGQHVDLPSSKCVVPVLSTRLQPKFKMEKNNPTEASWSTCLSFWDCLLNWFRCNPRLAQFSGGRRFTDPIDLGATIIIHYLSVQCQSWISEMKHVYVVIETAISILIHLSRICLLVIFEV